MSINNYEKSCAYCECCKDYPSTCVLSREGFYVCLQTGQEQRHINCERGYQEHETWSIEKESHYNRAYHWSEKMASIFCSQNIYSSNLILEFTKEHEKQEEEGKCGPIEKNTDKSFNSVCRSLNFSTVMEYRNTIVFKNKLKLKDYLKVTNENHKKAEELFVAVEEVFFTVTDKLNIPSLNKRKNLLSYNFLAYKIYELILHPNQFFDVRYLFLPLYRTKQRKALAETIWRNITQELEIPYYRVCCCDAFDVQRQSLDCYPKAKKELVCKICNGS